METLIVFERTDLPQHVVFTIEHDYIDKKRSHIIHVISHTDTEVIYEPIPDGDLTKRVQGTLMLPVGRGPKGVDVLIPGDAQLTLKDLLLSVYDGERCLDAIERGLDGFTGRATNFAQLTDIALARRYRGDS